MRGNRIDHQSKIVTLLNGKFYSVRQLLEHIGRIPGIFRISEVEVANFRNVDPLGGLRIGGISVTVESGITHGP